MILFVFDIETVPGVESGRRQYGLDDRNAAAMFHLRAQETEGSGFLRYHLHRILTSADYDRECRPAREDLQNKDKPQLQ